MTTGGIALYLAALFAAYFAGLGWGVAAKFINQMGNQA